MFELAARQKDDTYISPQIGAGKLALGQALIEGFGMDYDPRRGYRLLERAALENGSREALAYLAAHREEARLYGLRSAEIARLCEHE